MAHLQPRYRPRLRITVEHDYYASGRARGLHFEPDNDTAAWLGAQGCMARDTGDGIELIAPAPGEDPALPAAVTLTWFVRCEDSAYASVTADLPRHADSVLHFQLPTPADAGADPDTVLTLHAGAHASPSDAWPAHPPGVLAGLLVTGPKSRMPAFLVSVPAPVLGGANGTETKYRIAFAARSPVWKYCLLGDWSADPLRVEDAAQQTVFAEPVAEVLDNGQAALSIRSRTGIALRERADNRYQLRSRSAAADRILVKRLPVAGADHFTRETLDGVPTLVSEIFVHR